jgi:hypothetical protein
MKRGAISRPVHVFRARSAVGRHAKRTNGSALAAMSGTRSLREERVPPASTDGLKRSASLAPDGRLIRSGTRSASPFKSLRSRVPLSSDARPVHGHEL